MEKDAPLKFACVMVTGDPPVLVKISDKFWLLPTCTLPNVRLLGFGDSAPSVTPFPVNAIVRLGFAPFEVTLTLPEAAPPALGLKLTVNEVLCPALSVTGNASPLKLNPDPLAVADEIVRLLPPVLVKVSDKLEPLPTCTLPNANALGFGESVPWVTPFPVSGIIKLGLPPFDVTLTLPEAAPPALGLKLTVNDVLCPAFNVIGNASPLRLNPVPLALAAEIVRLEPPVLVSVCDRLALLPTCMLPNAMLLGLALIVPAVTPVPASGILRLGFEPFETMLILPLAAPLPAGVNVTVNEVLCPAFN